MKFKIVLIILISSCFVRCNSDETEIDGENIETNIEAVAEEGYKNVNGVKHFYKTIGQGEPFFMLHSGPGMYLDEMYPFFLDFAQTHKLIFYDQRGNGKSLLNKIDGSTFSVDLMVEDLEALRKEFKIEKINIIGHSWGGLLAMYYATKYPDNVNRLILIDALPVNTPLLIKSYQNQEPMFNKVELKQVQEMWDSKEYAAGDPRVHNKAMKIAEGSLFYNKDVVKSYTKAAAYNEVTAKNSLEIDSLARDIKLNIFVQENLSKIKCPTLLIYGKEDFIAKAAPKLANHLIPNSELVYIDSAGHYPHIENPRSFFEHVNTFIEKTNKK